MTECDFVPPVEMTRGTSLQEQGLAHSGPVNTI